MSSEDIIRIGGVEYEIRGQCAWEDGLHLTLRPKRKQTGWIKRCADDVEVHITLSDHPYYPANGFKPFYGKVVE